MTSVFVDTGPLIALNSHRDQHFHAAKRILGRLQENHAPLLTTDYIIDEASTYLLTNIKSGYVHACNLLDWFSKNRSLIKTSWIEKEFFYETMKVFRRFNKNKQWSFTDCTSYVVMRKLKIKTVFTFDAHFEEMGFSLL